MYNLFTDSDKVFNCKVDVQGVPLSECYSRIILETNTINLIFKGSKYKKCK
jgi:hypothetical protein